jgi:hypothetical protein
MLGGNMRRLSAKQMMVLRVLLRKGCHEENTCFCSRFQRTAANSVSGSSSLVTSERACGPAPIIISSKGWSEDTPAIPTMGHYAPPVSPESCECYRTSSMWQALYSGIFQLKEAEMKYEQCNQSHNRCQS